MTVSFPLFETQDFSQRRQFYLITEKHEKLTYQAEGGYSVRAVRGPSYWMLELMSLARSLATKQYHQLASVVNETKKTNILFSAKLAFSWGHSFSL